MAELIIITAEGERVRSIPISSESSSQGSAVEINTLEDMEWLNNNKVGYHGHDNPSLGEYRILDINTGKYIASYLGARFRWSPDKSKLAQFGWQVHFDPPESKNDYVQINGETVYSLPKDTDKHYIKTYNHHTLEIQVMNFNLVTYSHVHAFKVMNLYNYNIILKYSWLQVVNFDID